MKCADCENEKATYECIDCGEKRCEWCAEGGGAGCNCQPQQFVQLKNKL